MKLAGKTWALFFALVVLFLGFGSVVAKAETVGFVTFSLQVAFFQQTVAGARQAADELGVELIVLDPQGNAQRQVEQVETLIARGVDAIVLNAIEVSGVMGVIEEAGKRGIPVVAIDQPIDSPYVVSNVATDSVQASREFGRFITGWILATLNGEADIGIMLASTFVQLQRREGFLQALESLPNCKVVFEGDGRNVPELATAVAEDLILSHPEVDVIYATGDPQLQGALAAMISQDRLDIALFGWDLDTWSTVPDHFVQPIQDGQILAFLMQRPFEFGYYGVQYAVKAARGEPVPSNVATAIDIVTKYNLDRFRK